MQFKCSLDYTTAHHIPVCQLLKKTGLSLSGGDSDSKSLSGSTPTTTVRFSLATNVVQSHLCIIKLKRGMYCTSKMKCCASSTELINSHHTPVSNGQKLFGTSLTTHCPSRSSWTKLGLWVLQWFRASSKWDFSSSPKLCNNKILCLNSPRLGKVQAGVWKRGWS